MLESYIGAQMNEWDKLNQTKILLQMRYKHNTPMTDQGLSPEQARCMQQQQEKHLFYLKETLNWTS